MCVCVGGEVWNAWPLLSPSTVGFACGLVQACSMLSLWCGLVCGRGCERQGLSCMGVLTCRSLFLFHVRVHVRVVVATAEVGALFPPLGCVTRYLLETFMCTLVHAPYRWDSDEDGGDEEDSGSEDEGHPAAPAGGSVRVCARGCGLVSVWRRRGTCICESV